MLLIDRMKRRFLHDRVLAGLLPRSKLVLTVVETVFPVSSISVSSMTQAASAQDPSSSSRAPNVKCQNCRQRSFITNLNSHTKPPELAIKPTPDLFIHSSNSK